MADLKLKPQAAPATSPTKDKFIGGGTARTLTPPRVKFNNYAETDSSYLKMFIFGPMATGKTLLVKALLDLGFKVLVISTDVGGSGLTTVTLPLKREGTWAEARTRLREVEISGYEAVTNLFAAPSTVIPDIDAWDPDFVFWDGSSSFQQIDVSEYCGEIALGKDVDEAVSTGIQNDQQSWGRIRNATVRAFNSFCDMKNATTGKVWHKIATGLEALKHKTGVSGAFTESKEPLLQGAGGKLAMAAFDIVMRSSATSVTGDSDKDLSDREYTFSVLPNQNNAAKLRGFDLKPSFPADGVQLFQELFAQLELPIPTPKPFTRLTKPV